MQRLSWRPSSKGKVKWKVRNGWTSRARSEEAVQWYVAIAPVIRVRLRTGAGFSIRYSIQNLKSKTYYSGWPYESIPPVCSRSGAVTSSIIYIPKKSVLGRGTTLVYRSFSLSNKGGNEKSKRFFEMRILIVGFMLLFYIYFPIEKVHVKNNPNPKTSVFKSGASFVISNSLVIGGS